MVNNLAKQNNGGLKFNVCSQSKVVTEEMSMKAMKNNLWFPYNQRLATSPEVRLFCFAHSGGVASVFRDWKNHFPSTYEILPVQLPGRESRFKESLILSMGALIEELVPQITPFLDVPIALFGHSLGAVIAFELAQALNLKHKSPPLHLFVSACSAPSRLDSTSSQLHKLPEEEFIKELIGYGAMPQKLLENREALQLVLPRLRADFSIFETYRCANLDPIAVPITGLGGVSDDLVSQEDLAAWKSHTTTPFSSYLFPGGHFYYYTHGSQIAEKIVDQLSHFS